MPYFSLRIDSSDDVETAVLLLVVGLAVGELAARGQNARAAAARGRHDLASLHELGALVARGEDADYVLMATEAELTDLLGLVECVFESTHEDTKVLPVIARDGSVTWGRRRGRPPVGVCPSDGATIPVWSRGARLGRFILTAPVAVPYSLNSWRRRSPWSTRRERRWPPARPTPERRPGACHVNVVTNGCHSGRDSV